MAREHLLDSIRDWLEFFQAAYTLMASIFLLLFSNKVFCEAEFKLPSITATNRLFNTRNL